MAEYIEKQAAIEAASYECGELRGVFGRIEERLKALPPADVRPAVKGHWERAYGDSRFMCSVCKGKEHVPTIMGKPIAWDYCPNCGAEMEGGESDG